VTVGLAGYIVIYAILVGCAVVCFMKGKIGFAALGILLPILWIVGAVRPAKPDSAWADRFGDAPTPLR
jgi:lysyl-tRNA synthetase class 2